MYKRKYKEQGCHRSWKVLEKNMGSWKVLEFWKNDKSPGKVLKIHDKVLEKVLEVLSLFIHISSWENYKFIVGVHKIHLHCWLKTGDVAASNLTSHTWKCFQVLFWNPGESPEIPPKKSPGNLWKSPGKSPWKSWNFARQNMWQPWKNKKKTHVNLHITYKYVIWSGEEWMARRGGGGHQNGVVCHVSFEVKTKLDLKYLYE